MCIRLDTINLPQRERQTDERTDGEKCMLTRDKTRSSAGADKRVRRV